MTDSATLTASRFGLLLTNIRCYQCQASIPAAALWVGDFKEQEDGEILDEGAAALLTYVECLDDAATQLIQHHAPWMRLAATLTFGKTYWANHCQTCGAIQGDHFVREVDGPFWPQDEAALVALTFIPGVGTIQAVCGTSQSSWMTQVEDVCRRI